VPPRTLGTPARCELRVRGSRFIACAGPASDEAEAAEQRRRLRRAFDDATHHCWALRLLSPQGVREWHDDAGEPAGTAGAAILQALRGADVVHTQVVVARYFGGTKLGKGGLARTYREAARGALQMAGMREIVPLARLRLQGPPGGDGAVRHLVARHAGRILEASYAEADRVALTIEVPEASSDRLLDDLGHLTRGSWRRAD